MATLNVYEQYYAADLVANGVPRHAALVMLQCTSGAGQVRYEAAVTFFPHRDDEDFAVSYDAFFSKVLYEGKGRRSKNREENYLSIFCEIIDALVHEVGGEVYWDRPLRDARWG